MRKSELLVAGIIVLSVLIGAYFYNSLPDRLASHWNVRGEVDGTMSKFWALSLMPVISFFLLLLFVLIPRIDPLKANIEKFRKQYDTFVILIILFLFYVHLLSVSWNLGNRFSITQLLAPAFAILFYYCGILIEKTRPNWFIGVRTPWTLSSERVWEKTHRIAGKMFRGLGAVALFALFFGAAGLILMVLLAILIVLYTVIYSYFEYQKEQEESQPKEKPAVLKPGPVARKEKRARKPRRRRRRR